MDHGHAVYPFYVVNPEHIGNFGYDGYHASVGSNKLCSNEHVRMQGIG